MILNNNKPSGILLINKPKGKTSFSLVSAVRRASGVEKVGHAGTLDPMATGLLVLLLGEFTKRSMEFSSGDKTYHNSERDPSSVNSDPSTPRAFEAHPR